MLFLEVEKGRKRTLEVARGERFGKLKVVEEVGLSEAGRRQVLVRCSCGVELLVDFYKLVYGKKTSCTNCRSNKKK